MKKLFILSMALMLTFSCSDDTTTTDEDEVVIETLTGSTFTLSQFEIHAFPATDTWEITDQSVTADDFEGLSAAIEYISLNETSREISLIFSGLDLIPNYAIFGRELSDSARCFSALYSVEATNVTSIGAHAFEFCDGLTSVNFGDVDTIGKYAFNGCASLKAIDLSRLTIIEDCAFNGCRTLEMVDLSLAESIGTQAFMYCDSMSGELSLPVASQIGIGAFAYCSATTSLDAPNVLYIDQSAFCECSLVESFSTPIIEEIGDYAFIACTSLKTFDITESLLSIGNGVFNDCTALEELILDSEASFAYDYGVLFNDEMDEAIIALPSVVKDEIALDMANIRPRAFYNCDLITSLTLTTAESVSVDAFAHCNALETVSLPLATELESGAFYDCDAMTTFSAPYLTIIGCNSFYNCDSLETMTFATAEDALLTSIDENAFYRCYIEDTVVYLGSVNTDLVTYGDTLTLGSFSAEFKKIYLLE